MKLNLGCGNHFPEGWINADLDQHWHDTGKDIDLIRGEPLPWENDTFDQIILFLVLNHVPLDEMDGFLSEVERILSPEGRLLVLDEHHPDDVPEHKIHEAIGTSGRWHCYAEALDALLCPFFSSEILWKAEGDASGVDFAIPDSSVLNEGRFNYTDSDGFAWPIKGLGQHSCLIVANSNGSL